MQLHRLLSLALRMSLADFCQNFEMLEVCHLTEDTLSVSTVKKPWKCTPHHGKWIPYQGAWASHTQILYCFKRTSYCIILTVTVFVGPPQYNLTLLEEDDDPSDPELTCSFLLALMQKHTRKRGVLSYIALQIFKVFVHVFFKCVLLDVHAAIWLVGFFSFAGKQMFTSSQTLQSNVVLVLLCT